MIKKILIGILIAFIAIQFIRPSKNISGELITQNDISHAYEIPEGVHEILVKKCYDCHSNNTTYPWYYAVQPVAWWMAHHIDEGKEELNFSEFKSYKEEKAAHKLEELSEAVNEGWMPLESYLWVHHEAKISTEDQDAINAWLKTLPISLEKK